MEQKPRKYIKASEFLRQHPEISKNPFYERLGKEIPAIHLGRMWLVPENLWDLMMAMASGGRVEGS